MNIFHWYVVREHIAPFVFAFCVIMFVLILKLMLELMEVLISRGVGIVVMAQLLMYNLAWMVALVIPMSVLVASVMAFGRMGASGEIIAMKTAGISMYRIVSPVIMITLILTMGMIWFNKNILPEANLRAGSLRRAVFKKKPLLSMKNREGQFISDNDIPFTFRVESVDDATEEIFGVILIKREGNEPNVFILAEKGRFLTGADHLELLLTNGEIHRRDPKQQDKYMRIKFNRFIYTVKDLNFNLDTSYESSRNDRNMTTPMMRSRINELENMMGSYKERIQNMPESEPARERQIKTLELQMSGWKKQVAAYLVEIHKKNSIPVAALVFVLIGSSLGILVRRSGASIGIGMSIGFFALYYLFLIGGETMGDRMILTPWLAMWLPNIILGPSGVALFVFAARR